MKLFDGLKAQKSLAAESNLPQSDPFPDTVMEDWSSSAALEIQTRQRLASRQAEVKAAEQLLHAEEALLAGQRARLIELTHEVDQVRARINTREQELELLHQQRRELRSKCRAALAQVDQLQVQPAALAQDTTRTAALPWRFMLLTLTLGLTLGLALTLGSASVPWLPGVAANPPVAKRAVSSAFAGLYDSIPAASGDLANSMQLSDQLNVVPASPKQAP